MCSFNTVLLLYKSPFFLISHVSTCRRTCHGIITQGKSGTRCTDTDIFLKRVSDIVTLINNAVTYLSHLFLSFRVKGNLNAVESNDIPKVPFEAANKDAFFNRVESYSISFDYFID